MSARSHRLSLSRKRKRNASSYSPQVEVIDVDEELSSTDKDIVPRDEATLSELHTRLCEDYAERLEKGSPQPQTVSSEVVGSERARSSTNSDVEHSLVKKNDHVDDFDVYSQDWRVWNPQSVSESSLMTKKQTKLHSFFSYSPAARRKLHSSSDVTAATTASPRENKKRILFSSSTHTKVKSGQLQNSKPTETSSHDATSVESCASSLDTDHSVVDSAKLPASLDAGMAMATRSDRSERSVSSQGSTPSSSQQLQYSQSGATTSMRRKVCPQYKWIPGMMILLTDVKLGIYIIYDNLASPNSWQALWGVAV